MKYRIDVAMSGRLGMEIQPKNMTDDEKNTLFDFCSFTYINEAKPTLS